MDWGMIGAVVAVIALVPTTAAFYIAWRSEQRQRRLEQRQRCEREEDLRKEKIAREEDHRRAEIAERTAATLAIIALVRRLDEHQILTPEVDDLGSFYGTPPDMIKSAKSIRNELLNAENTLRKAESILDEKSYKNDIVSLQKMAAACKNFLKVLEPLALREDLREDIASGGSEFYYAVSVPHYNFRETFETEIMKLAERHGIQRKLEERGVST